MFFFFFFFFFPVLKDKTLNDVEKLQDEVKELKKTSDELLQHDVPGKFPYFTGVEVVMPKVR